MNPPVDAPASRQRRPGDRRSAGTPRARRPACARRARRSPGRRRRPVTRTEASPSTAVAGLRGDHAAHLDPPGGDQLAGLLARARQAAADQFGVQAAKSSGHRGRDRSGVVDLGERALQLRVDALVDVGMLDQRELGQFVETRQGRGDVRARRSRTGWLHGLTKASKFGTEGSSPAPASLDFWSDLKKITTKWGPADRPQLDELKSSEDSIWTRTGRRRGS